MLPQAGTVIRDIFSWHPDKVVFPSFVNQDQRSLTTALECRRLQ